MRALVVVVALVTSGCSLAFVRGPEPGSTPGPKPACTTSLVAPIVDSITATSLGIVAFGFLVSSVLPVDEDGTNRRLLTSAGLFVGSATFAVSSGTGFSRVGRCKKLVADPSRP